MIYTTDDANLHLQVSAEQMQAQLAEYSVYSNVLATQGNYAGGEALQPGAAASSYTRAISSCTNATEHAFMTQRLAELERFLEHAPGAARPL